MKNTITFTFAALLSITALSSQKSLYIGYGHNTDLVDDRGHKFHTLVIGGERDHFGISMEFDIRNGDNYFHDIYPQYPLTSIDTRWVLYWRLHNLDVGPYVTLNSTSFEYDGWTSGIYGRLKFDMIGPIGFFTKINFPLVGKHRHWDNLASTNITFNTYSSPEDKYRSNELRIAIGAYIKLFNKE